jgi:mannosyltransferase OCH1-like enzyme
MTIPKKIHYCWFGNKEKPLLIKKCIDSWSKLDNYEVIEWNEENFDINSNNYTKVNYKNGKYAFVSDFVRLKVLYEYGGIYLDTDVEIKKNFDDEFLKYNAFIPFMFNCNLSTAIIGAEPKSELIKMLLDLYEDLKIESSPNNDVFTNFFLDKYPEFRLNNKFQVIDGNIAIFPKEYFECPTYNKKTGYSVHHIVGSWWKVDKDSILKKIFKTIIGNVVWAKLSRYKAIKKSPFYNTYVEHKK